MKIPVFIVLSLIVLIELIGRYYGLTDFPLYDESKEYEYLLKPNQDVSIYRNRFITNEFSMRSKPISQEDTLVILLVGDSVLNGGNSVDHDSLASTLLENDLIRTSGKKIRVLNVSDKTWSPDNVVAYLTKYGTFHADMIILVANSGDAFDPMTFEPIVGVASTHPARNALFAWQKIIEKAWPLVEDYFPGGEAAKTPIVKKKSTEPVFINGFEQLNSLAKRLNIPFCIYLHRMQSELKNNEIESGGKAILDFCQANQIPVKINQLDDNGFIDDIHLNNKGQKALEHDLLQVVRTEMTF